MDITHFDDIRPFTDEEAQVVFKKLSTHPAIFSIMRIINPYLKKEEVVEYFESFKTIDDFQRKFSYPALRYVIDKTSDGLTYEGLEELSKDKSHLFISTHRDIMLDTSLLNFLLLSLNRDVAEAAIGDNLVKRETVNILSRLNRNFIVKRSAPVREMLENSKHLSSYIQFTLHQKNRSVWIAQREGRTKDGLDATHPGLLKMLTMAADRNQNIIDFLKQMRIVPLSISYEYDPNDRFKISELIAKENNEPYLKERNEDFRQIVTGIIGAKKRIKLVAGKVLDQELDQLEGLSGNKLLQKLSEIIDFEIIKNYQLWPSNFIAFDELSGNDQFSHMYNSYDVKSFMRRIEKRAHQHTHDDAVRTFLEMYANPVRNKIKLGLL